MTFASSLKYLNSKERKWKLRHKKKSVFEMYLDGQIDYKKFKLWLDGKIDGNKIMIEVGKNGSKKN